MNELVAGGRDVIRNQSTGRFDGYLVKLDAIKTREGFNHPRHSDPDYPAHVRELADSIKANGFYRHKPLTVFAAADGFLYPSDGHSRFAAVLLANEEGAGIESVPVVNETKGTTEEDRIVGLITNNNGKRLTPYGEGLVIKQLIGRGLDEKEIARRLGFATSKVSNLLDLVAAPREIVAMVTEGSVSATTAIKAIKQKGAGAVEHLQEGVRVAKAAGKTKASAKHMKTASEPVTTDTQRLDFIAEQQCAIETNGTRYSVLNSSGASIATGDTAREAIDKAMLVESALA